jgi:NAD(P)-dependent dehydrogenase (short-subunit alcohol dehydrogenase family)
VQLQNTATRLTDQPQFGFLKQVSSSPDNLVIGLVRNKAETEKKVASKLSDRGNVHIVQGDLASYVTLKQAAAEVTRIVGDRGIDYLIANGAYLSFVDAFDPIGAL